MNTLHCKQEICKQEISKQKQESSKPPAVFKCSHHISKTGFIKIVACEGDINEGSTDHPWFSKVQITVAPYVPPESYFVLSKDKFTHTEEALAAYHNLLGQIEQYLESERGKEYNDYQ